MGSRGERCMEKPPMEPPMDPAAEKQREHDLRAKAKTQMAIQEAEARG